MPPFCFYMANGKNYGKTKKRKRRSSDPGGFTHIHMACTMQINDAEGEVHLCALPSLHLLLGAEEGDAELQLKSATGTSSCG